MKVVLCVSATIVSAAIMVSVPARADNCLETFSCQLYGPCPLPCLDRLTSAFQSHPQAQPAVPAPATPAAISSAAASPAGGRELADTPGQPAGPRRPKAPRLARKIEPRGERLAIVRVVTAPGITSLAQLAGKPVSFGPEGDPSQVVGRRLFAKLGVKVDETPLAFDNAIDGVGSGDVAAVVVLHERDVAKLKALSAGTLALLAMPAGAAPPTDMRATTLSPATAGPLAHGRSLRAFAIAVADMPRLARRLASATP